LGTLYFLLSAYEGGPSPAALLALGLATLLLIPPFAGATRSRALKRARSAEAENRQLREDAARLMAQSDQALRGSKALADWLTSTLMSPYKPRSLEPDRDFDAWLSDILIKVMRVVFPDQGDVSIAVVREYDGSYVITHSSAAIPEEILSVAPARVRKPLAECIKRHAPDARVFSFPVTAGRDAWVAFFPEQAFDDVIHGSSLASIGATVAHVYTSQRLGVKVNA
jgi:hypothetical protein